MEKKSNGTVPETISIRRLSAEVSLGLRTPVVIRAGEVSGGRPGRPLVRLYAYMRAYNAATARKE